MTYFRRRRRVTAETSSEGANTNSKQNVSAECTLFVCVRLSRTAPGFLQCDKAVYVGHSGMNETFLL